MTKHSQTTSMSIGGHKLGPREPCLVIAEAGVNHNGDLELAKRLIGAAAVAKADAVKFQTFNARTLVTADAEKADYQKATTGESESQQAMLKKLELRREYHGELKAYAEAKGLLFLSTPFDEESADFLESLGVLAFKIPSGEITNLSFLKHVAAKQRPMIVSTGMSDLGEVEMAVRAIRDVASVPLVLLHCVSQYPADAASVNLRAMQTLHETFGCLVGFSDHTEGFEVALAARALGACVIEKHFTLDRGLPGPDHRASLEPEELSAWVHGLRKVESALGDGIKRPVAGEDSTARVARKSLIAARGIAAGSVLSEDMLVAMRPGTGIAPSRKGEIIGRRAKVDIAKGSVIEEAWIL